MPASHELSPFVTSTDAEEVAARAVALELPRDPAGWLAAAEDLAAERPGDRSLAALVLALEDRQELEATVPRVVAGVRRDRLVRWDARSATFVGTETATLAPAMVRMVRAAAGPAARRALGREWRLLRRVLPLEHDDESARLPLAGSPLGVVGGAAVPRALGSALADLGRWSRAGLWPAPPGPEELRLLPDGRVAVAALTCGHDDEADVLATLAARVDPDDGLALGAARTLPEASGRLVQVLAEQLAGRRHALVARWRSGRRAFRRDALRDRVERLAAAVPHPRGVGAVGVDLDGRITVVRGGPDTIVFGAREEPEVVWDPVGGFRPPIARRLLRARAIAPPNPALDAAVGGDPLATERLCRWVADGLRLRTVRMLLEAGA